MDIIKSIEHEQLKNKIPELKVGNTVRVHVRIKGKLHSLGPIPRENSVTLIPFNLANKKCPNS